MTGRHLTTTVTMLVLLGLLVAGAVWGWQSLFAEVPDEPAAKPACETELVERGDRLRSRQVLVSVFNAGTRSGLADSTLERLTRRGFLPGEAANAPADIRVRRVQVWTTLENDPRARLVARQFGKARVRVATEDLGPGIDVVVGNKLRKLRKAPRGVRVRETQEFCIPAESADPLA